MSGWSPEARRAAARSRHLHQIVRGADHLRHTFGHTPGEWGRGIVGPRGEIYTWPESEKDHRDMARLLGMDRRDLNAKSFAISPEGALHIRTASTSLGTLLDVEKSHPDLYIKADHKKTLEKELSRANLAPRIDWKIGQWGKGLVTPEGRVIAWPEGEMEHSQRVRALGIDPNVMKDRMFSITPDGLVAVSHDHPSKEVLNAITTASKAFRVSESGHWEINPADRDLQAERKAVKLALAKQRRDLARRKRSLAYLRPGD